MQELLNPQLIIQGGGVLIALYLAYTLRGIISNHINHNTSALNKLVAKLDKSEQREDLMIKLLEKLLEK